MALFTGATVEEAIERGLKVLNVKRENVHIEIERSDSQGFLGFGKKRARVNISPISDSTTRRADREATRGLNQEGMGVERAKTALEATLELHEVVKKVKEAGISFDEDSSISEQDEIIEKLKKQVVTQAAPSFTNEENRILSELTRYIQLITDGLEVPTQISSRKDGSTMVFDLRSDRDALLIGKHGKTLQSIQILARAYSGMLSSERLSLIVNVGDYHEKRKAYISSMARHAASKAREGETVYINDLQASERKIVHSVIAKEYGVNSHSEGSEPNRYVVVSKDI